MKKYKPGWLNRYLLVSLLVHLLLLLFISRSFEVQPVTETPLSFEIVNPVVPKAEKPPKPKTLAKLEAKPKPAPKPKPKPEPIRHYRDLRPIDPTAKLSINKDGQIKKKAKAQEEKAAIKQRERESANKIISPPPPIRTSKPKPHIAPPPPRQVDRLPFEPGDIFVKRQKKRQDDQLDNADKPSLEDMLANLEKYIDFDKYSQQAYYFGGSKLSFEDQDFHYVWYGRIIKRRVSDGWYPPYVARMGLTGRTVVTFRIQRDGSLSDIKLSESSGNRPLDQAALNAVQSVGHLPELPEDYQRPTLGVIFSFWYNLRIPRENGAS